MNSDNKIIGGMFGLPDIVEPRLVIETHEWKFLEVSNLVLANARSGIMILIDKLVPANVWMPSYLCPTMIEVVDREKTNLEFYEVNYDLQIASIEWIDQVQTGDLVVLIDYFGFPLDSNTAILAKKRGAWILEDACQALLSEHVGQYSDFILFSPKKFIGVPDGGILVSYCDMRFDNIELGPAPVSWWLKVLESAISRREFDRYGGGRRWYKLFQETGTITPCGCFAMSDLSMKLLLNCFDYSQIAKRRRENYSALLRELKHIALFKKLPRGTVPLGFPVRFQRRNRIRENLFQEQIYPPVHWAIDDIVPEEFLESHRLTNEIMTLPCDQRYNRQDMKRMTRIMLKLLKQ